MKSSKSTLKNIISAFFILLLAAVIVYWAFGTQGSFVSGKDYPMNGEEFRDNPALSVYPNEKEEYAAQITPENLADFLCTYELPQDVYWTLTYVDVLTEDSFGCNYRLKGDRQRLECYKNGKLFYYYIFSPDWVIQYNAETNQRYYPDWQEYDVMSFIFMTAYDDLRSIAPERVISVSFETLLNQRMIFIEYKGDAENEIKKCWISLEHGIPIVCETYRDGVRINHVTTGSFGVEPADPIIFQ